MLDAQRAHGGNEVAEQAAAVFRGNAQGTIIGQIGNILFHTSAARRRIAARRYTDCAGSSAASAREPLAVAQALLLAERAFDAVLHQIVSRRRTGVTHQRHRISPQRHEVCDQGVLRIPSASWFSARPHSERSPAANRPVEKPAIRACFRHFRTCFQAYHARPRFRLDRRRRRAFISRNRAGTQHSTAARRLRKVLASKDLQDAGGTVSLGRSLTGRKPGPRSMIEGEGCGARQQEWRCDHAARRRGP